ncbi:amino acid transporter [Streptomyces pactum]|uniref:Amino acid transporter n=1 Tax=Streptomyces pactum TaxID=68249 RepID=A0ABS0NSB5_9ACTN|nr:amino acid transporter [Streptomyces pactum]MBH5338073.1 amino acid transporter [Streptomyces pactum]
MTDDRAPYGTWEPASTADVVRWFAPLDGRWWVAGGVAIELAVGHRLRGHGDIDVLMLRRDQAAAQRVLAGWEWWCADPPGRLRPWAPGEVLPVGVHDIWCRPGPDEPWRVQLMLDESDGPDWTSRRDVRVRRPVRDLGARTADGTPYLVPEVQLYYKARSPRPKDETDFEAVLPVLSAPQRRWLADAITLSYGPHPWTDRLSVPSGPTA